MIHLARQSRLVASQSLREPTFKQQFPALRDTYGELSAEIHAANESPESFERELAEIDEHFDARRVFKLSTN